VRFLHTADWQLGMTRHFLSPDDQATFAQARLDAVVRIAELAGERDCAFVVVAGDVFETNQPDRTTVARALDALRAFDVPVYLLPGNHDAYDPGSVYRTAGFSERAPAMVEVLTDARARTPIEGVEVVGAPWPSKRPSGDPVAEACAAQPADGTPRIVVGHGPADCVSGDFDQPGTVRIAAVEAAIAAGRVSYVALGDRHSTTSVGASGRIWYAGAPEPTSYREEDAGNVLVVELDGGRPQVERVTVGTWRFVVVDRAVDDDADIDALLADLDALPDRARTIAKVKVSGTLSLQQAARLERELEAREAVLGALEHPERHRDVTVRPDPGELAELPLRGPAAGARDRLLALATAGGAEATTATDALALLVRLSEEARA
jgi:DNA repair exonuclease SbcCD nuclease subunit